MALKDYENEADIEISTSSHSPTSFLLARAHNDEQEDQPANLHEQVQFHEELPK
jgi:hypothetical protein